MKNAVYCLFALAFLLLIAPTASAQCVNLCLTSFVVSPSTIYGDQSEYAIATVHLYSVNPSQGGMVGIQITEFSFGSTATICVGGQGYGVGCSYPYHQGDNTFVFEVNGSNFGSSTQNGTIQISFDVVMTQPINVNPVVTPQESPTVDPDAGGPCTHCGLNGSPSGSGPINFANGNTWITQTDYTMPGLGGGFTLSRTWNSLWPLSNPPEQSGIFGDSWRSNLEERIQMLTGGVVRYWKGDGNSLFYTFNTLTGAYVLTAPLDDQTTLSFNTVWTVTLKNGTRKTFNSGGYLTSIVDLNSNTTTISIDAAHQNRIASVTDASGHVLTFNYTNATFPRLCTSITDSVGTFTSYQYDTLGRLAQVLYPDGSQYNFQFNDPNSNTLISKVTDSLLKTVEAHTYDSQRRGITAQQANDSAGQPVNKVTANYNTPFVNMVYVTDSKGNGSYLTIRNVAQSHYLVAAQDACASCAFTAWAKVGILQNGYENVLIDANNNVSYYSYDTQGNVTSKSLPQGNATTGVTGLNTWNYTYNSLGEVLTATDPLGNAGDPNHTTTNTYDARGNLLTITTPSPDGTTTASATTFTPNAQGQVSQIKDPLNHATSITYCTVNQANCPYGLISFVKDVQLHKTTYTYDGRGNAVTVTDPTNHVTQFQYDAMNRVTLITYPTSPATTVQIHYDWRGRRDYVIDQNNNKTTYGYDDADRLISVTDAQTPTAGVTTYQYDTENNLTDIYDANTNHTHFDYNVHRQLTQTTFASGYIETYTFDLNNNLTNKTDRLSQQIHYSYDFQNRLYQKSYPDSTSISYTYDAAGRLATVVDPTGTYGFAYDNMNRLKEADTNYSFDTAGQLAVKSGYDAASNRTSMTDPQNLPTAYGYDTLNRINSLAFNGQNPGFTFGYDGLSRRTSLNRPNGVNTAYLYDTVSRVTSILHKLGTTTLDGATYTYDSAGNRKTRTDKRLNTTLTYTYDNIYQLQLAKQGTTTKESYTYDAVGNRLSSLGVSPYTYNSSNELTGLPGVTYTYDRNGSVLTKSDGTAYAWDYENRLKQVTLPGTGGTVTFKYDPFGRRIQKSGPSSTTNYLYDGVNLLEEVDNSGNVIGRYTQSSLVDEPLSMLRSGVTSFYENDAIGSITSLTSSAGTIANTYSYDAYGKSIASTGTLTNPFQYTAREFDQETGLQYFRARYYESSTGRFLSEDPLGFGSIYPYAFNNPVGYTDPSGKAAGPALGPILVGGGAGVGAGFGAEIATGSTGGPVGALLVIIGLAGTYDYQQGHALCVAQGWCHASPSPQPDPQAQCKKDDCNNLLQEIYRYMNTINGRINDLLNDPLDLYNLAYDTPNPALPPKSGTYVGHQGQVEGWQGGLRKLLEDARKKGCPIPPGAWSLASRPIPSQPRGN